ncbi:MAG TPA: NADH-quinone oxidoreductase subunit C [Candidatus Limnocylindrales bacterium]|nr:NADH-quinone oxidoreductase subunit C [Candidatus Limnocylindrales bacterium]
MSASLERVGEILAGCGGAVTARAGDRLSGRLPLWEIRTVADRLAADGLGLELQLLAAADTRAAASGFTLAYVFGPPTLSPLVTLLVPVDADPGRFPSIATRSFAASRFEREIHDLFGLVPVDHPEPRRLALHQVWPEGYHPLRRDVPARTDFTDSGEPFPFRRVEGDGVFEITVGPVHAGIIEPGHFRFSVDGETVVNLETRMGFVHKGTEKLFETLPFERGPAIAERVSGDTSVGHALAYCQAVEALAASTPPPRASWLRVILLELERLYNHVGDVGMIVNDTGFSWGHAHCFRLREELLRLNERVTGHRLLRGAVVPGGTKAIETAAAANAAREARRIVTEFLEIAGICLDNAMVLERLLGTGRLTTRTAREMQVVGLVGRASGIAADARRDAPFAAYGDLEVVVAGETTGDVWARTRVRIDEAAESARLIEAAASRLSGEPARAPLPPLPEGGHALGLVEAWRGPVLYWVLADGPAALARVKVMDPSFRNWPALEYAVLNNIVPDFPLCNKSFNLSYSGSDL